MISLDSLQNLCDKEGNNDLTCELKKHGELSDVTQPVSDESEPEPGPPPPAAVSGPASQGPPWSREE